MHNVALATIMDEHRSLVAVMHGLRYLVKQVQEKGTAPDFRLLWAMVYYIDAFSQQLHHPKENAYLFAALKARTHEADKVIADLEWEHEEGSAMVRALEHTLGLYEAGAPKAFESFSEAIEHFARFALEHIDAEERLLIPLARKHLTQEDWMMIAEAFSTNGDPRFGSEPDHEFRDLFTRIVNLAPPPIGVGPSG